MSILIPGMEMPESCYLCPVNKDDGFGFFTCGVTHTECDFLDRPAICPLVPVPDHGRLIDADVLEQDAQKWLLMCNKNDIVAFDKLPAADVQPVRHGRWMKTIGENGVTSACRCNLCGFEDNRFSLFSFCPNCGAKMDGEA